MAHSADTVKVQAATDEGQATPLLPADKKPATKSDPVPAQKATGDGDSIEQTNSKGNKKMSLKPKVGAKSISPKQMLKSGTRARPVA